MAYALYPGNYPDAGLSMGLFNDMTGEPEETGQPAVKLDMITENTGNVYRLF